MKIINESVNNLLKRREIVAVFQNHGNPGFALASKKLSEKINASEEQIVVKSVKGHFGNNEFKIEAFAYDSVGDKEIVEPKKKVKKSGGPK